MSCADEIGAGVTLRQPRVGDFAVIAAWITDADACLRWAGPRLAYPFAPDELPALLAHPHGKSFCLAEADGEPLGFGQYWEVDAGAVHLGRIIVAPDSRGQGLGRQLCRQLIVRALQATGAHSVTLRVFWDNAAAVALYASLGFTPVASKSDGQVLFMALPA